jgi:hypothetical protein
MDLSLITIGGPCKLTDVDKVIYFEGDVTLTPNPVYRAVENSLTDSEDGTLVDMTWTISGVPVAVWNSDYRAALLPATYRNFTVGGGRIIGATNRAVQIDGADGERYVFHRAALTRMPDLFLGLGSPLYSAVEYTAFIKTAAAFTDADAFYTQSTGQTWSQADFPNAHQEALCTAAWGAVTGWTTVYSEDGFRISHELGLSDVKQGNVTVDKRITSYRAACLFRPQGPTTAQLLSALQTQGTSKGIGTRLSTNAADFVVTGSGISVTVESANLNKGAFQFSNKMNRHGEWGMINALTAPGDRLTLA